MTSHTSYPDGTWWETGRGQDTRIIIRAAGSFSPRRARELADAIEWEAKRAEEIVRARRDEEIAQDKAASPYFAKDEYR